MVKIALIQQSVTDSKTANVERGLTLARQAIASGAQVICFAELAFEPFYPQVQAVGDKRKLLELAESIPGPTTEAFQQLAAEHEVVFVLNLYERDGDLTYDSSPVIDADGTLLGVTRMIHITDYPCFHEKGYYEPGDSGAPVYETRYGRVGVSICYDRHYPEFMRALGVQQADLVVIPQAGSVGEWPAGLYEAELRVASFQNGYYSALCNRVGQEDQLTFAGESFVADPEGNVIARASLGTDEILYCDLDFSKVTQSHARRLFMRDRRPNIYSDWI